MSSRKSPKQSTKRPNTEPREAKTDNKKNQPQDYGSAPVSAPITVRQIETPKAVDRASGGDKKTAHPKQGSDKWMTRFTGLIFAATLIYAIATIFQLKALNNTIEETKVSRELDNRAWVTLKEASLLDMAIGQKLTFEITYINSGKTPALRTRPKLTIEIIDTVTGHVDTFQHEAEAEAVLGPGTEGTTVKFADAPFDQQSIDLFSSGRKKLYVRGVIEYDDIFKRERRYTNFCLLYRPPILNLEDCGGDAN